MSNRWYGMQHAADEIARAVCIGEVFGFGCHRCESIVYVLDFDEVHSLHVSVSSGHGEGRYRVREKSVRRRVDFYDRLKALPPWQATAGIVAIVPHGREIEHLDNAGHVHTLALRRDLGMATLFTLTPLPDLIRAIHEFRGTRRR